MKQLVFIALFVSSAFCSLAQTGIIKGFVYEKANSEPIIGATLSLKDKNKGTQSNVNGFFLFQSWSQAITLC
jgi:hypothetical protein